MSRKSTGRCVRAALLIGSVLAFTAPGSGASAAEAQSIPVMIQTVPEMAGVRFSLNGTSFVSNKDGLALTTINKPGRLLLALEGLPKMPPGERADFVSWSDGIKERQRPIVVESFTRLELGLERSYPVSPSFVDGEGNTVALDAVDRLTLEDDRGETVSIQPSSSVQLPAERITPVEGQLVREPVDYLPEEVSLDGNTVPAAWQGGPPSDQVWRIEIGLHTMRIQATDALFSSPVDASVRLQYPDGRRETLPLAGGHALLESLPAGDYVAEVTTGGFARAHRFSLPSEGMVALDLFTMPDLIAIFGLLALALLALVFSRRGALAGALPRRYKAIHSAGSPTAGSHTVIQSLAPGSGSTAVLGGAGAAAGYGHELTDIESRSGYSAPQAQTLDKLTQMDAQSSHSVEAEEFTFLVDELDDIALPPWVDEEPPDFAELDPDLSAKQTCSPSQRRVLLGGVAILGFALIVAPMGTVMTLIAVSSVVYLASLIYRIALFVSSLRADVMISVSEEDARAIPDHDLPTYTVLVPIHNEAGVAAQLLAALDRLDYPKHKLDVRILLEEDDIATYEACLDCRPPSHVTLVRVPDSQPKTKPKACNYGVQGSKGELLTIYDAEDLPDTLQLRRAVAGFQRVDEDVACLQARLGYYNPSQNLLTRWFTIEYGMWFALLLPGLMKLGAPLPLGGTSLHIRRSVLDRVGRWDAYNVTEDADLGVRLTRFGYRVMVLDSITYEEANSDFVNWVRQRSRWYKGYMQTWLVHLRHPVRLWRELGPRGFIGFNLFIGGTPLMTALNPLVWFLTLYWFAAEPAWIPRLFPGWVFMIALVCWVFGNATWIYTGIVAAPVTGNAQLALAAFLMPVYWVMMSMAAVKAMWQLILQPSFWEKTVHGLSHSAAESHKQ